VPDIDDDQFYRSLGLKCGLEIHQQLTTEKKLFCRCPAIMKRERHGAEILRHMRPTLSELGEYDGTALMEFKTKKEIIYQLFPDVVCTYEMDDTPPFPINQQAVDIALEISLLLNCNIVNELHVSRKQYLDGSIPTGFQRTAIVGVEGWIPFKDRKIGIIQLGLEEDACREVKDEGHRIIFRTDRLSIPLVEVVTHAHIQTPREAGEVAERLGRLMRTTRKVRRGIGSVRQDVNVSITGGTRVEIKGVARHQYIPRLVAFEALRQRALLQIRDVLKSRGVTEMTLRSEERDLTNTLRGTNVPAIKEALEGGGVVMGVKLEGFGGILDTEIGPGRIFAQDISGRIRVIACLDRMPNMVHSSKFTEVGLSGKEIRAVNRAFRSKHTDEIVLTWGLPMDADMAVKEIVIRAKEATMGIPNETRQVLADGTTCFERILPGPDRMYPDTDTPPMEITEDRLDLIRTKMPEFIWKREERLIKLGMPKEVAKELAISLRLDVFDKIMAELAPKATLAAITLTQTLRCLRRSGKKVDNIPDGEIFELFDLFKQGRFAKEAIPDLLAAMADGRSAKEAYQDSGLKGLNDDELAVIITEGISKLDGKVAPDDFNVLMGLVMKTARGRVDGGVVANKVKKMASI
jgi:glutamyl-tRNA(Gln) amidotransferase subunit E